MGVQIEVFNRFLWRERRQIVQIQIVLQAQAIAEQIALGFLQYGFGQEFGRVV